MPAERRSTTDLRRTPTRPLSRYSLRGRRKKARREAEDKNYYVDRYESSLFLFISLILALCVLDAYFTLKIIDFGGKELNRLMLVFIYSRPVSALVFKYLVTAISIIIILVHKNFIIFGRVRVLYLIYVFFFVYLTLVAYEAVVFFSHIRAFNF
jgi:hypothetical protein